MSEPSFLIELTILVLAIFLGWHRPRLLDGLEDLFFVRGSCLRHADPCPVELDKRRACGDAKIACPSPRGIDAHRGAGSCQLHRVHGP